MDGLTAPQQRVLAFIRAYIAVEQRPPTKAEIAAHFEWKSVNAAQEHCDALVRKGFIRVRPGARGLMVRD